MDTKQRAALIIEALKEEYPEAVCALKYEKDYQLMIAVRLSAQCTDARVNLVTPAMFERWTTLEAFANADIAEIEDAVKSCGFYKHKARDIVMACKMLVERFDGKIPGTMAELLTIPGIGRKTANLLLGDLYGEPGSVVCDTHCIRITGKLGLTDGTDDPVRAEMQLRKILPPEESSDFCHRIVLHGRAVCTARKPSCGNCCLAEYCSSLNSHATEK